MKHKKELLWSLQLSLVGGMSRGKPVIHTRSVMVFCSVFLSHPPTPRPTQGPIYIYIHTHTYIYIYINIESLLAFF